MAHGGGGGGGAGGGSRTCARPYWAQAGPRHLSSPGSSGCVRLPVQEKFTFDILQEWVGGRCRTHVLSSMFTALQQRRGAHHWLRAIPADLHIARTPGVHVAVLPSCKAAKGNDLHVMANARLEGDVHRPRPAAMLARTCRKVLIATDFFTSTQLASECVKFSRSRVPPPGWAAANVKRCKAPAAWRPTGSMSVCVPTHRSTPQSRRTGRWTACSDPREC